MAMLAILDAESQRPGRKLIPDDFRWDFRGGRPSIVDAAFRLQRHLETRGVPTEDGSSITIVDSSFKGTVQEVLAALYPDIEFRGAYIWHGPSPADPHPATKQGYLQHVTDGGKGNIWETVAYEYSMRGSLSSPTGYGADGSPIQVPIREDDPYTGIERRAIASEYRDPTVRDAIMEANRQAAVDYARHVAGQRDPRPELELGVRAFREGTRSWRHDRQPRTPPRFLRYLDSFVTGGRVRR
jgi:hypothetical protein